MRHLRETTKPRPPQAVHFTPAEQAGISERRACHVIGQARSTQRHDPVIRNDEQMLTAEVIRLSGQVIVASPLFCNVRDGR